jgi:hypothetical protein
MEKFDQMSGNDSRGELCQNENYMDAIKANSGRYKIEDAGINSPTPIMELPFMQIKLFASAHTGSLGQDILGPVNLLQNMWQM